LGFSQDNILHLIKLYKYDCIYEAKLYFNYKEDYSIYFKIIPIDDISKNCNHYSGLRGCDEPIEYNTIFCFILMNHI